MKELFYQEDLSIGVIELGEEESRHLIKVLRFQSGDTLQLTNGKGSLFNAKIIDAHIRKCRIEILNEEKEVGRRPYTLHIAIAPTKNLDRMEWFLEKATEIGIDKITPLICSHSERREVKTDRLQKILVAAMKQSLKCQLPELGKAVSFQQLIQSSRESQRYICTQGADEFLATRYDPKSDCIVLIGPEGDFSVAELSEAKAHGFLPVSLGNSRLRTETAGLMVCATLAVLQLPGINPEV